jgi:hypothetical protein
MNMNTLRFVLSLALIAAVGACVDDGPGAGGSRLDVEPEAKPDDEPTKVEPMKIDASRMVDKVAYVAPSEPVKMCALLDDSGARVACDASDGCVCVAFDVSRAWPAGAYCAEPCD